MDSSKNRLLMEFALILLPNIVIESVRPGLRDTKRKESVNRVSARTNRSIGNITYTIR